MWRVYVPSHFAATSEQLSALLSSAGLVDLVSVGPDGLIATPLPMLFQPADGHRDSGHGCLQGHVARNNPHWRADAERESLAIVRGPDAYISPSWYPSKAEHGRVVPTWNYLTVHVYGQLVVHEEPAWLRDLVGRLTQVYESSIGSSWQMSDAPAPYIEGQLRAIVGVELVISRIEAKAKLSQNRSDADQNGVLTGLGPDSAVAAQMRTGREATDTARG